MNLILADNTTLNAASGIDVPQGSGLTVRCQSGKSGEVTAVEAQISSDTTVQPTYFEGGSKIHTASVTTGGNTYTDVQTEELPALTGDTIILSNAVDWEKAAASINNGTFDGTTNFKLVDTFDNSTAVTKPIGTEMHLFAGSFDGNDLIQIRSDKNNSGIITITSGGLVSKVSVDWNGQTTVGRTLNIYGSHSI